VADVLAEHVVFEVESTDPMQLNTYVPGRQCADAELFYANANQFVDDVQGLVEHAPDPVRWVVLDAGSLTDVDYSAGVSLAGLIDYLQARGITFALARADTGLLHTLQLYGIRKRIPDDRQFASLDAAVAAFRAEPVVRLPQPRTDPQGKPVPG
jgi:MFS superfamily sulfate permease-like transporter